MNPLGLSGFGREEEENQLNQTYNDNNPGLGDSMNDAFNNTDELEHQNNEVQISNPDNYSSTTAFVDQLNNNNINIESHVHNAQATDSSSNLIHHDELPRPDPSLSQQLVPSQTMYNNNNNPTRGLPMTALPNNEVANNISLYEKMSQLNPYVAQTITLNHIINAYSVTKGTNDKNNLMNTINSFADTLCDLQAREVSIKEKNTILIEKKLEYKRERDAKQFQHEKELIEIQHKCKMEAEKLKQDSEKYQGDQINEGKKLENERLMIEKGLFHPTRPSSSTNSNQRKSRGANNVKTCNPSIYQKRVPIIKQQQILSQKKKMSNRSLLPLPTDNNGLEAAVTSSTSTAICTRITHDPKPELLTDDKLVTFWKSHFISMDTVPIELDDHDESENDMNNPCNLVTKYLETASPLFVFLTTVYFYDMFSHNIRMQMRDKSNVYAYACKKPSCIRCNYNKDQERKKGDDAVLIPCYGNLSPLFCGPILYVADDFVYIHLDIVLTLYSYFNLSGGVEELDWTILPEDGSTCGYIEFNDHLKYYFSIKPNMRSLGDKRYAYYLDRRIFNHFMSIIVHDDIASPTKSPDFNFNDDDEERSKNYFYPPAFAQYKGKKMINRGRGRGKGRLSDDTTTEFIDMMPKINPTTCPSVMPTKWIMVEMVGAIAPPIYTISVTTNNKQKILPSNINEYRLTNLFEDAFTYRDTRNRDKIEKRFTALYELHQVADKYAFSILKYSHDKTEALSHLDDESITAFKVHLKKAFPKFNVSRIAAERQKIIKQRVTKRKNPSLSPSINKPIGKSHLPPFKRARRPAIKSPRSFSNSNVTNVDQEVDNTKSVDDESDNEKELSPHPDDESDNSSSSDDESEQHPDDESDSSSSESEKSMSPEPKNKRKRLHKK